MLIRITDGEIASLCVKYLAWDEPVSKRDIALARHLFDAQLEADLAQIPAIERAAMERGRKEVVGWIERNAIYSHEPSCENIMIKAGEMKLLRRGEIPKIDPKFYTRMSPSYWARGIK